MAQKKIKKCQIGVITHPLVLELRFNTKPNAAEGGRDTAGARWVVNHQQSPKERAV